MSQLSKLKELTNAEESDTILQFYIDCAGDIICDIRNSDIVETKYLNTQIMMAIELYNKRGAEGQTGHSEFGISRTYTASDISPNLLAMVIPIVKTPWSTVRVIT